MKRLAYLLIGLSMMTLPLSACGSKDADDNEVQDTLDFELDSKTQVEAPGLDSPQYSIEDNNDSLDDLLGSPQSEDISNEPVIPESNSGNDVDDILNLLEQTIDSENPEQSQEQSQEPQDQPAENQEPSVSISVTESANNTNTQQTEQQQTTERKVPNTGIYPD